MPKKEGKNKIWVCVRGRKMSEGTMGRALGEARGRKHKSVALLGWMLTPVRDY